MAAVLLFLLYNEIMVSATYSLVISHPSMSSTNRSDGLILGLLSVNLSLVFIINGYSISVAGTVRY